jgi:hypothetical protein
VGDVVAVGAIEAADVVGTAEVARTTAGGVAIDDEGAAASVGLEPSADGTEWREQATTSSAAAPANPLTFMLGPIAGTIATGRPLIIKYVERDVPIRSR